MFRILCTLALGVYTTTGSAQFTEMIDSLKREIANAPRDTHLVKTYYRLADQLLYNDPNASEEYRDAGLALALTLDFRRGIVLGYEKWGGYYMAYSDYPKALKYYGIADSLLQTMNWPREQAILYGNYAAIYKDRSVYDSALLWNDRFLEIAHRLENPLFIGFGLSVAGDVYRMKGQDELAGRNFIAALRSFEEAGSTDRQADALRSLGTVQTTAGNYPDAALKLRRAITLYEKLNEQYFLAQTYRDLGYLLVLQDSLDQAMDYYEEALQLSEALEDDFGRAQVYENFAEIAIKRKQFEAAESDALKALELFQAVDDRISTAGMYHQLAEIYYGRKSYAKALEYNQQAEAINQEVGSPAYRKLILQNRYNVYKAIDRPRLALAALEEFTTIKDSLFTLQKAAQLEELQIIYEVEKKDQEIELLEKDVQLGQLRRQRLLGGLLATLLLAALVVYMQFLRRRQDRKIAEERRLRQQAELERKQSEKDQLERELASQVLQLCRKNELLAGLQNEIGTLSQEMAGSSKSQLRKLERTIRTDIESDTDWEQFLATFNQVHPHFLEKLRQQADRLSPAEQRLACLFKMNLSSKEIATLLNITDEGVKKARYRLRKKLDLSSDINLAEYLINVQ